MSEAFTVEIPIRFGDCDAAGIVFYPRYFEMLNRTVEDWFARKLGRSFKTLHLDQKLSVPTARFEVDFHAPSRLEETLTLSLTVEHLGRTSCVLHIEGRCVGAPRLTVRQVIVFASGEALGPLPWPDDLRAAMTPFIGAAHAHPAA